MNVVYASDNGYVMQLGTSLLSLLVNNQELQELNIYCLDGGIEQENVKRLQDLVRSHGRSITFIQVHGFRNAFSVELNGHGFNEIVYARLLLTDYLPESVDSVLYLDCDTVIDGSLETLEHTEFVQGELLAAVPELYMPPKQKAQAIGFKKRETYYNAGVLLINLKQWREEQLKESFLEYYAKHHERLLYNDQDIINAVCKGRIATLPQSFNMSGNQPYFPIWYLRIIQPAYVSKKPEAIDMIQHPKIIHYLGDERPWVKGNKNYYRKRFYYYKKQTVWRDVPDMKGRERYMQIYHLMNVLTRLFPHGRMLVTKVLGIKIYTIFKKK